jgi:hypothetical protein
VVVSLSIYIYTYDIPQRKGQGGNSIRQENQQSSTSEDNIAVMSANSHPNNTAWYLDSGATRHICKNMNMFDTYSELKRKKEVKLADGKSLKAIGVGTVNVKSYMGTEYVNLSITDVLYVPDMCTHLFSQGTALDKGFYLHSDSKTSKLIQNKTNKVCAVAKRGDKKRLYKLNFKINKNSDSNDECLVADSKGDQTKKTHQHVNHLQKLLKEKGIE